MADKIVLSIPVGLKTREIVSALESQYGAEYVLMGRVFQSTATRDSCEIEICDRAAWTEFNRDNALTKTFEAGQDKLSVETLRQLDRYQQVIYLISTDTGYQACLQLARLAQIFLNIGGIAIMVESAGIAHEQDKWLANYNSDDVFEIYSLFVGLVEGDDYYYSCGMQNFGKADVAIALDEDIGLAIYVMNVFNYYRLTESSILQDGHTFQPDIESPIYRMKLITDLEHEINSPLYNPHGRWLLI